ncbi:MAG: leucyl aminopeptidase [Candidatus Azotimanducaceae bacterium]|jgi:leucyl aminopeptidase
MLFGIKSSNPAKSRAQCIMVGIYEGANLSPTAKLIDETSKGYIKKILKRGDITGKIGETCVLHDVSEISVPRVMLVGLGKEESASGAKYILIVDAAIRALKNLNVKNTLCCLAEASAGEEDLYWKARKIVEHFNAALYSFTEMRGTHKDTPSKIESVDLFSLEKSEHKTLRSAVNDGQAISEGVRIAKDLGNMPSNICHPSYLAAEAVKMASKYKSLSAKILSEKDMEKLGMHSLLSVGHGSAQPSKLIIIHHKGGKPKDQPHVLVGKGVTFDTGGISLKPGAGMWDMIYDMCGAATVFGTMKAIAEQNLPINVICVIAAAENMPSDRATRPGDIVTSMSGQTIEILNTDAEGRLVLCDALTYVERFKPKSVIDVATLTGAVVVALGSQASAVYANDEALAKDIDDAGKSTLDRVWRMPLWDEYQVQLKSAFADVANIGGREAGSITAACFLSRFTKKYRWAHLDVAGTAFKGGVANKGATGRPVTLLTQYLMDRASEA